MKAMDKWRQLAKDTKLEYVRKDYEELERRFSQWSTEFNSGNAPEEREIDSIRAIGLDTNIDDVRMPEVD